MNKMKKQQPLATQIQKIIQKMELTDDSIGAINDYYELLAKGIIVKKPFYVDFSGFRQEREQTTLHRVVNDDLS